MNESLKKYSSKLVEKSAGLDVIDLVVMGFKNTNHDNFFATFLFGGMRIFCPTLTTLFMESMEWDLENPDKQDFPTIDRLKHIVSRTPKLITASSIDLGTNLALSYTGSFGTWFLLRFPTNAATYMLMDAARYGVDKIRSRFIHSN